MNWLKTALIMTLACLPLHARSQLRGWCEQGNKTVLTTGVAGAPKVQGSYPQCTVTVRLTATGALASIYADNAGTVKANPFTADVSGYWYFYADDSSYDITLSGAVSPPFTLSDVLLNSATGSGNVTGPVAGTGGEIVTISAAGTVLSRSALTGVAKLTAGVPSVVTGGAADCVKVDGSSGACAAGTGDVTGPASAVDSNFAGFNTGTGKLLKDSGSKASDFAVAAKGVTNGDSHDHTGGAGATLTKTTVGLANVDNTSDATKNAASATLTNKTLTLPILGYYTVGTLPTPAIAGRLAVVTNGAGPDPCNTAGASIQALCRDSGAAWVTVAGSGAGGGLSDPGSNGLVVRTAANTTIPRTLIAGVGVSVTNGSGISGNPTVAADTAVVLTRAQEQAGSDVAVVPASASGTAYTASLTPTLTAYTDGMALRFRPDVNCTGSPSTLNVDTLGAKKLFAADGTTSMSCTALAYYLISYDASLDAAAGAFRELVSNPVFASASDVTAGTNAAKAVTPDALAGSTIFGTKTVQLEVFGPSEAVATGDGKVYFVVPPALNGMNLVGVKAQVIAASSSGTPTIQIVRCAYAATGNACSGVGDDMLSTRVTIDANENSTTSAATPAVIDTTKDDVATDQVIRVDVDVAGTGTLGLLVTLIFQLP
jgi:hypothetical protein